MEDIELLKTITYAVIGIYTLAWIYFVKVLFSYFPVTKIEDEENGLG